MFKKRVRKEGVYPLAECIKKLTITNECPEWFIRKLVEHGCMNNVEAKLINKTN